MRKLGDVSGDAFEPISPSSLIVSQDKQHSGLYSYPYMYIGVITQVLPPTSQLNKQKYTDEFKVSAIGPKNSIVYFHCVATDGFGGNNDQEFKTLGVGSRVVVMGVMGNSEDGIILGHLRNAGALQVALGKHWFRRFNKITESITKDSERYIRHDDGTEIMLTKDLVSIKDKSGNSIVVSQKDKKITISDGQGEQIIFDQAKKKLTILSKDVDMTCTGKLNVKVTGDADVQAKTIKLNGSRAGVVTGGTGGSHPIDYMTGKIIKTVKNVKAGS